MTGRPQTRVELVEGLGTSVTTVNRVASQLEKAGAIITREVGSDGRHAVFRVVEVAAPKVERPYLHIGDRARVNVRFESHGATSGDRVVVLESVRNVTIT